MTTTPLHAPSVPAGSQTGPRDGYVLVGFAPDTTSAVLDQAAQAATRLGGDIVLLHVAHDPTLSSTDLGVVAALAAVHLRSQVGPGVRVTTRSTTGPTVAALVLESHRAGLLVLGAQRDAGAAEVVHRDVISQVAALSSCPVLVVHTSTEPAHPGAKEAVTVGVADHDGDGAIRAGLELARSTGRPLSVLHTWCADGLEEDAAAARTTRLRDELDARVAPLAEGYPDVDVTVLVWSGRPEEALVTASVGSSVVVLGRAPVGGLTSVARVVLREARCPVLVAISLPHATATQESR